MGAVPSPFQDYSFWIFVYLSGFLGLVFCFQSRPAVPVQVCGLLFFRSVSSYVFIQIINTTSSIYGFE